MLVKKFQRKTSKFSIFDSTYQYPNESPGLCCYRPEHAKKKIKQNEIKNMANFEAYFTRTFCWAKNWEIGKNAKALMFAVILLQQQHCPVPPPCKRLKIGKKCNSNVGRIVYNNYLKRQKWNFFFEHWMPWHNLQEEFTVRNSILHSKNACTYCES